MSNTERESIISRIKKLFALANNNPSENEAISASLRAQELLVRHNIEIADLELNQEELDQTVQVVDLDASRKMPSWKRQLIGTVADMNMCHTYTHRSGGVYVKGRLQSTTTIKLVGKPTNTKVAQQIFDYLCDAIDRISAEAIRNNTTGRHGKTFGASFRAGMVSRIQERLSERKSRMMADGVQDELGTTTALAIRDAYKVAKEQINVFYVEQGMKFRRTRISRGRDMSGYHAGRQAGDKVGLDDQLTTGRKAKYLLK